MCSGVSSSCAVVVLGIGVCGELLDAWIYVSSILARIYVKG